MSGVVDGNAIRSIREARGWDQQTLARAAGVNPSVVSRLERGLQDDLKASVLVAIAQALSVPTDHLLQSAYRQDLPEVTPELAETMAELSALPPAQQRQVLALLRAYLSTLPQ